MKGEIILKASKVKRRQKVRKIAKLTLLILILLLLIAYAVIGIIYSGSNFSIILDRDLHLKKGIIIYDDPDYKVFRSELFAKSLEFVDNISYKWLPDDLNDYDGSHNGENYVAYTFYVENIGEMVADYWSEVIIDEVMKNVDDAIRIRVYKNGEYITYAKMAKNGGAEKETVPFDSDTLVVLDHVENFSPGDINKYTIVIWLEGNDPECTDNILGGGIKIHMEFNSELIER